MANALTPILTYKREEVAALKASTSLEALKDRVATQDSTRGFANALSATTQRGENALICELKRKSPSAGEILPGDILTIHETFF